MDILALLKLDWAEVRRMTKNNDNTFVKITNSDIFKKLCVVEEHVMKTNGKVKLNWWIATTALTLALALIPLIIIIMKP